MRVDYGSNEFMRVDYGSNEFMRLDYGSKAAVETYDMHIIDCSSLISVSAKGIGGVI